MKNKIEYPCDFCGEMNSVDASLRGAPMVCHCCGKSSKVPFWDIPRETDGSGNEGQIAETPAPGDVQVIAEPQEETDMSHAEKDESTCGRKILFIKIAGYSICAVSLLIVAYVSFYLLSWKNEGIPEKTFSPAGTDKTASDNISRPEIRTGSGKNEGATEARNKRLYEGALRQAEESLKEGTDRKAVVRMLEKKLPALAGTKYEVAIKQEIDRINSTATPNVKKERR